MNIKITPNNNLDGFVVLPYDEDICELLSSAALASGHPLRISEISDTIAYFNMMTGCAVLQCANCDIPTFLSLAPIYAAKGLSVNFLNPSAVHKEVGLDKYIDCLRNLGVKVNSTTFPIQISGSIDTSKPVKLTKDFDKKFIAGFLLANRYILDNKLQIEYDESLNDTGYFKYLENFFKENEGCERIKFGFLPNWGVGCAWVLSNLLGSTLDICSALQGTNMLAETVAGQIAAKEDAIKLQEYSYLAPILLVYGGYLGTCTLTDLFLDESQIEALKEFAKALGGDFTYDHNELYITEKFSFDIEEVNANGNPYMAMAAIIASQLAKKEFILNNVSIVKLVDKSFLKSFKSVGGIYEEI